MKKALITGIYGQDGSYLCELLTHKGYEVHGIARSSLSIQSEKNKKVLLDQGICPEIHTIDLYDYDEMKELLLRIKPDEIYHVAAFHVSSEGVKERQQYYDTVLFNSNITTVSNILSICMEYLKKTKVFTAGSCLMYDATDCDKQDESTEFCSDSLYGLAKITENQLVAYYRRRGLFACTGILYNHESARRQSQYVTKKIVENMIAVKSGQKETFQLASLDAEKDWGYAGDYAYGMYLMLQAKEPRDYVLATGEMHTIRELVEICAEYLGLQDWQQHIEIDPNVVNRKVQCRLCGDSSKMEKELGWKRMCNFRTMIENMIKETIRYS